ncbi:hypothetical protein [Actinokineospora sp.]|uniref:hypothetical protein n=1 Tax=Actinokineospora sp. TaxID=1872133 RepID=UPI004037711B
MAGHVEEAAGALNAASQQLPVEHLQAAVEQLTTVVQFIQQAGGPVGETLTRETLAIQGEQERYANASRNCDSGWHQRHKR